MAKFKQQLAAQTLQTTGKIALATTAAGVALFAQYKGAQYLLSKVRPSEAKKLADKQAEATKALQTQQAEKIQTLTAQQEKELKQFNETKLAPEQNTLKGLTKAKSQADSELEAFVKEHGSAQELQEAKQKYDTELLQIQQTIQTELAKQKAIEELTAQKAQLEGQVQAKQQEINAAEQPQGLDQLREEKRKLEAKIETARGYQGAKKERDALGQQVKEKQQAIEVEEEKQALIKKLNQEKGQLEGQITAIDEKIGQAQPQGIEGKQEAVRDAQQALDATQKEIDGLKQKASKEQEGSGGEAEAQPKTLEQLKQQAEDIQAELAAKEKLIAKHQELLQTQQQKQGEFEAKEQEMAQLKHQEDKLKEGHQQALNDLKDDQKQAMDKLTGKDLKQKGKAVEEGVSGEASQKLPNAQKLPGKGDPSDSNDTIAKLITGLTGLFGFGYATYKHKDEIVKALGAEKGNSDNDDSGLE